MRELLVEYIPFKVDRETISEAIKRNDGRLIVRGTLQRANAKNENGRVYPKTILEREISRYMKNEIAQRRALGELDHPDCHRATAEILTTSGWKFIKDIDDREDIFTLNTINNKIEIQSIDRKINQSYTGKMISIVGKNINVLVTPNHRFVVQDRHGKYKFITAQDILDLSKKLMVSHLMIPKTGVWDIKDTGMDFHIDPISMTGGTRENRGRQSNPLVLNRKSFFQFMGFYLAEGHTTNRDGGNAGYSVYITQNSGKIADDFRLVLKSLSGELNWRETYNGEKITFTTSDARLWSYLSKLGDKYTKYIPDELKADTLENLTELFHWFTRGDGTVVGHYARTSVFTVSNRLIEDLHEVLLKTGKAGRIKIQESKKDYAFAGRTIQIKNKKPLNRLWVENACGIHLDFRFIKVDEVDYDDRVYCVSVPNQTFYCRDHGKTFWSGNSSVINLRNVSHNILEVNWNGDDVTGVVEILDTPSGKILKELFKAGVTLGISSRGLGSVKTLHEGTDDQTLEVQPDFELVTFDFVSNPSTHGAFMRPDGGMHESVLKEGKESGRNIEAELLIRDIICEISGTCCI